MSAVCLSPVFASLPLSDLAPHLPLIWFVYCACFWLPVSPVWLNQKTDSYLNAQRSTDRQDGFDYVCFLFLPSAEHLHRGAPKMRDSQGGQKTAFEIFTLAASLWMPFEQSLVKNNKLKGKWKEEEIFGKRTAEVGVLKKKTANWW